MLDYYDGVKIIKNKSSKPIAIEWRFSDGTRSYYYLKEEDKKWIDDFVVDVLKENALSRKERYHCEFSLDECLFEGETFIDFAENPTENLNIQQEEINATMFYRSLTKVQKRRLRYKLDDSKVTFQSIAEKEKTSKAAIFKTFMQIRKNYERFRSSFCS